jgi:hypothetical protein
MQEHTNNSKNQQIILPAVLTTQQLHTATALSCLLIHTENALINHYASHNMHQQQVPASAVYGKIKTYVS